jgi:hypothetical protein
MPKGQPEPPEPVEIERGGRTYHGHFIIDGPSMTVTWNGQSKTTRLGGMAETPYILARLLLREMVGGTIGRS